MRVNTVWCMYPHLVPPATSRKSNSTVFPFGDILPACARDRQEPPFPQPSNPENPRQVVISRWVPQFVTDAQSHQMSGYLLTSPGL